MYHTETAAVEVTAACARLAPLPSARHDMPDATLIARIATGDLRTQEAFRSARGAEVRRRRALVCGDLSYLCVAHGRDCA
jgi:hypothetical protein